jgi:S1-C subfamily serine protease
MGIVSAVGRGGFGIVDYEDFIQTDASINPGNSGGALVNMDGQLVGLNTAIFSQSGGNVGIGFAVPSNAVQSVAQQLIRGGKVEHAYLGVQLSDANPGATISSVRSDGPAAGAGLRTGDVVTAIDGRAVGNSDALVSAIDAHKPGDQVTLKVRRGGDTRDVHVKLGTRPS